MKVSSVSLVLVASVLPTANAGCGGGLRGGACPAQQLSSFSNLYVPMDRVAPTDAKAVAAPHPTRPSPAENVVDEHQVDVKKLNSSEAAAMLQKELAIVQKQPNKEQLTINKAKTAPKTLNDVEAVQERQDAETMAKTLIEDIARQREEMEVQAQLARAEIEQESKRMESFQY